MKLIFNTLIILLLINFSLSAQFLGGSGSGYDTETYAEGPLPVELSNFTATSTDNSILLTWITETEIDNFGFEVQRKLSVVNSEWSKVGFVEGNGTSQAQNEYNFIDENIQSGTYLYRLKQIDNDGKFEYSKVVEFVLGIPDKIELAQNYPNPFNPTTKIKFSLVEQSFVTLSVYNIIGEKISTLVNDLKEAGTYNIKFDASNLNSGIYFYRIEVNGTIKTNKMQLIK